MKRLSITAIVIGSGISVWMFLSLQKSGATAYHENIFALNQSGYGTVLARLGQTNLNRAWHFGAAVSELSHRGGEDEHAGHNHAEGEGHGRGSAEHEGGIIGRLIDIPMDFLVDLDAERYRRTSWIPLSKTQKQALAGDIEKMMLRGYNMDPTDYGAYDAYFHFLMYHELRGTHEDRERASRMSEYTIQAVFRGKVDAIPWLTAATATLNQFFLHLWRYQREIGDNSVKLPADELVKYQSRMGLCLGNYFKLRDEAIAAKRWEKISGERRQEADERARLALKMMEQFQGMIDRQEEGGNKGPI